MLTPHIAGVTEESNERVSHLIADKVLEALGAPDMSEAKTMSPDAVTDLIRGALMRSRHPRANAASVARALLAAELAGQNGHGLRRVEAYSAQARAGKVDGFATPASEALRGRCDGDRCGQRVCLSGDGSGA
jgi:hypothetical protein